MLDTYESKFMAACFVGAVLVGIFLWQLYVDQESVFKWMRMSGNTMFWLAGLYVGFLLLGGVWLGAKYKINVTPILNKVD